MVLVQVVPHKPLQGHKLLVLVPGGPPPSSLDRIRRAFPGLEVVCREKAWADADAAAGVPDDDWKDTTILVTGSALPTRDVAPKLQYVQLMSAGANHVLDHPMFKEPDVAFCTANGVHGPQISEWVIATFLALQHHIPQYLDQQKQGLWKRVDQPVVDSVKKRVGILGYGSIGRQVARVCTAMGMDVHAYTLHARSTPDSRRDRSYAPPGTGDVEGSFPSKWFSGSSTAEMHEFLGSDLDLLVVSLPLTPKTQGLLSKPEFEVLSKKRTFISNISRGPIVNTEDLIEALENDVIQGAALDVTDPEPLPEGHKLWNTKNLIITPHTSGLSTAYLERVLDILLLNLHQFSEGKELINKVNKKEGY
ncbi:D-isomer specific 2-hydroxyacid dehydrogenase [Stachybotrys elegans]|uniref:D-isomer specific 2-hydroxyacid dehydrogenase n=1 Tax=Stachybotrys elegans TaxID=80388 RepID=A0A8K0SVZ8_9HYPO|nr:D-isomer specific 2-hydroxyacid dehydrogenase [Stachybotrys elegans]